MESSSHQVDETIWDDRTRKRVEMVKKHELKMLAVKGKRKGIILLVVWHHIINEKAVSCAFDLCKMIEARKFRMEANFHVSLNEIICSAWVIMSVYFSLRYIWWSSKWIFAYNFDKFIQPKFIHMCKLVYMW